VAGYGYFRPIGADGVPAPAVQIQRETGLKIRASVVTGACPFSAGQRMICWTYRQQVRGQLLGSTCSGDSGGPLFADHRGRTYLVGITSAGDASCLPNTSAYETDIFPLREWIAANIARYADPRAAAPPPEQRQKVCTLCTFCDKDLNRPLGDRRPFNTNQSNRPAEERGVISIDSPREKRLRVSANCTPGTSGKPVQLRLKLVRGAPQPCDNGSDVQSASSCEVAVQAGQRWEVIVDNIVDRQCQIVATTFDN
jgi:hypothetical protein